MMVFMQCDFGGETSIVKMYDFKENKDWFFPGIVENLALHH